MKKLLIILTVLFGMTLGATITEAETTTGNSEVVDTYTENENEDILENADGSGENLDVEAELDLPEDLKEPVEEETAESQEVPSDSAIDSSEFIEEKNEATDLTETVLEFQTRVNINPLAAGGPYILDISEWQVPAAINYDALAKEVSYVIVRIQYGSDYVDKHYKTHIQEFQKRGVPVGVYAWVRGINLADMEVEATDFYNRAKAYNPTFWWLDLEEQSMPNMRAGANAYKNKLKALGANKVGAYIAHHLYAKFNIDVANFDGIWIPHYGVNNGQVNSTPSYATDLHQFTSVGKLNGYSGNLDLNRLIGNRSLDWFTNGGSSGGGGGSTAGDSAILEDGSRGIARIQYVENYSINVYSSANPIAESWTSNKLKHGTEWKVYGEQNGMLNVGGNQWIEKKYTSYRSWQATKKINGGVNIYQAPNAIDSNYTGSLTAGIPFEIFQSVKTNGEWYLNLGGQQWVKAEHFTIN